MAIGSSAIVIRRPSALVYGRFSLIIRLICFASSTARDNHMAMEKSDILAKLKELRGLVDEMIDTTAAESRQNSGTKVKEFLQHWSKELKQLERNKKGSIWSRLFRGLHGAKSVSSASSSKGTVDSSSATSASETSSGVESSNTESGQPPFSLMTAASADRPSIAHKPTAVVGDDDRKTYDSYDLQTICDDQQESVTVDTQMDQAAMNCEGRNEMALKTVLDSVTALFEGSEDGVTVEVLDVAPCEDSVPTSSVDTIEGNQVETTRATGLVRQLINAFNRFKM